METSLQVPPRTLSLPLRGVSGWWRRSRGRGFRFRCLWRVRGRRRRNRVYHRRRHCGFESPLQVLWNWRAVQEARKRLLVPHGDPAAVVANTTLEQKTASRATSPEGHQVYYTVLFFLFASRVSSLCFSLFLFASQVSPSSLSLSSHAIVCFMPTVWTGAVLQYGAF